MIHLSIESKEWQQLYDALSRLLSRHGKGGNVGEGDYWILDDDYGNWGQKILSHRGKFLTPEVVAAMRRLLARRFHRWEILVVLDVLPDEIGVPPEGLTVLPDRVNINWDAARLRSLLGRKFKWWHGRALPKPKGRPTKAAGPLRGTYGDEAVERKWKNFCAALIAILSPRGKSDEFGRGDYWLDEEFHSSMVANVRVFRMNLVTPDLVDRIRKLLRAHFRRAYVVIQLDTDHPRVTLPPDTVTIHPDRIDCNWDARRLKRRLGNAFRWPVSAPPRRRA